MSVHRLPIIIEQLAGSFLAYCPRLPGCQVSGRTYEEALARLREAVEFHLADRLGRGEEVPSADQVFLSTMEIELAPPFMVPQGAPKPLKSLKNPAIPPAPQAAPTPAPDHAAAPAAKSKPNSKPAVKPAAHHRTSPGRPAAPERAWSAGEWVEIEGMPGVGKILEADARRRQARVLLHSMEFVLAYKKLRPGAPPELPPPAPYTMVRVSASAPVSHEIDLHGMRVEEALAAVDRALDQAVIGRLPQLKIIHGHGTGALRQAVRQMLQHHPHVAHFRFGGPIEGGLACTIAEIRQARP